MVLMVNPLLELLKDCAVGRRRVVMGCLIRESGSWYCCFGWSEARPKITVRAFHRLYTVQLQCVVLRQVLAEA